VEYRDLEVLMFQAERKREIRAKNGEKQAATLCDATIADANFAVLLNFQHVNIAEKSAVSQRLLDRRILPKNH
jgi:hypothetical protein